MSIRIRPAFGMEKSILAEASVGLGMIERIPNAPVPDRGTPLSEASLKMA